MANRTLRTPLGDFFVQDGGPTPRVGISEVRMLGMSGCDPICEWDLDMEEVLLEALARARVQPMGGAPGGWDFQPASALPTVERELATLATARAARLRRSGESRRTRRT
jgi:hypothetical protein